MSSNRSLHFSDSFCISCGTVTVDISQSKVLIIYWRKTGEYLLPKGRKNIGEALEYAALRETFEETGYRVELLPTYFPTLATPAGPNIVGNEGIPPGATTEPFAVGQRVTNGTLKIIYWFAAKGDSTAQQKLGTQEEGEDFDSLWVPIDSVASILTFDDDKEIANKALNAILKR